MWNCLRKTNKIIESVHPHHLGDHKWSHKHWSLRGWGDTNNAIGTCVRSRALVARKSAFQDYAPLVLALRIPAKDERQDIGRSTSTSSTLEEDVFLLGEFFAESNLAGNHWAVSNRIGERPGPRPIRTNPTNALRDISDNLPTVLGTLGP